MKTFRAGIILFCAFVTGAVLSTALPFLGGNEDSAALTPIDPSDTEFIPAALPLETSDIENTETDDLGSNITSITDQIISEDDLCLIAELIEAEAKGRSYMTRVCCAAVIFNRVSDVSFPSTVREVVYQPGAFNISETSEDLHFSRSFELTKAAVREAALGCDPTGGALYFADAEDKNSYVVPSFECGGMIFGK